MSNLSKIVTPKEHFLRDGHIVFPSAIPPSLLSKSIDELSKTNQESFGWDTELACNFRLYLRAFTDAKGLDLYGDGIQLSTFNRPVGGSMYWHDDEDGSNTDRVFICTYLTPTTGGRGAIKIIPGSHRGGNDHIRAAVREFRRDVTAGMSESDALVSRPELRSAHPDELVVGVPAGSIFVGNRKLIHAVEENRGHGRRFMVLWWQFMGGKNERDSDTSD